MQLLLVVLPTAILSSSCNSPAKSTIISNRVPTEIATPTDTAQQRVEQYKMVMKLTLRFNNIYFANPITHIPGKYSDRRLFLSLSPIDTLWVKLESEWNWVHIKSRVDVGLKKKLQDDWLIYLTTGADPVLKIQDISSLLLSSFSLLLRTTLVGEWISGTNYAVTDSNPQQSPITSAVLITYNQHNSLWPCFAGLVG